MRQSLTNTSISFHPSEILSDEIVGKLRTEAPKAEVNRSLTDLQRNIIFEQRWLDMYVPQKYRGLELPFLEILRFLEGIAWCDGSTGWFVTLCSGAAWFVGFLSPPMAKEIFDNPETCFAGSGAVTGTANRTKAGYEISGSWKYATGSLLATVFTMNCYVMEDGVQLYDVDGSAVVKSFLLKKSEVTVHNTWHAMGMIATGSHSFSVDKVVVPLDRSFLIHPDHATSDNIIFRYPFLQLAETTLAVNMSGMACRFIDLCEGHLHENQSTRFKARILMSKKNLNEIRTAFYEKSDDAWNALTTKNNIPNATLASISHLSHALVDAARLVVNDLYPLCGLKAADTRTEINRVWRNLHTAAQHSLFNARQP